MSIFTLRSISLLARFSSRMIFAISSSFFFKQLVISLQKRKLASLSDGVGWWCLTWCLRCKILVTDAMASFFSFSHLNKVVLKVRLVSCFYLGSRQELSGWEVVLTTKKNLSPGLDICYHVVHTLLFPQFCFPLWRRQFFLSVDKR